MTHQPSNPAGCRCSTCLLHHRKLKQTKARQAILDFLSTQEQPVDADTVFLGIRAADASVSLSTVYRVLEALVKHQLAVKRTSSQEMRTLFELKREQHRHRLLCTNCHSSIPLDQCPLDAYAEQVQQDSGFLITGHSLEFFGLCQRCRKSQSTEAL